MRSSSSGILRRSQSSNPFSTRRRPKTTIASSSAGAGAGSHQHLPLAPPRRGDPRALEVSAAIVPSSLATSPASSVPTIFLGPIPTILTHPKIAPKNPILLAVGVDYPFFRRIRHFRRHLEVPEIGIVRIIIVIVVMISAILLEVIGVRRVVGWYAGSGGEKREDAEANAERSRRREMKV